jgi:putative glutamine amidotransferase
LDAVEKPRIVVTLCGHDQHRCRAAREQYLSAIRGAGAEPVAVDPGDQTPERFEGLCLTGGGDIDPARYGEAMAGSTDIDPKRDELELDLARRALDRDVPVLGVCRGLQILNVLLGGTLEQHREGHSPKYPPTDTVVADDPAGAQAVRHAVKPVPGSRLAVACGTEPLVVNSSHHQVVTAARLAPGLRSIADVDGLVEALESPSHQWVVGVQWHPERTKQVDLAATRIFNAFVQAARRVPAR